MDYSLWWEVEQTRIIIGIIGFIIIMGLGAIIKFFIRTK